LEARKTPEPALARELKEDLGGDRRNCEFFRRYECLKGDSHSSLKFIYHRDADLRPAGLKLYEGRRLTSIDQVERFEFKSAVILGCILEDFIGAALWPQPVDKSDVKLQRRFVEPAAL